MVSAENAPAARISVSARRRMLSDRRSIVL
jgi:hypothetical protein